MQGATRFSNSLTEAANSLHGGIELQKPEQQYVDSIELKAAAFSRAANDDAILQHFNEVRLLILCMYPAFILVLSITCNQEACLTEGRLARNAIDSNSTCMNLLIVQMSIHIHSIQSTNIQVSAGAC